MRRRTGEFGRFAGLAVVSAALSMVAPRPARSQGPANPVEAKREARAATIRAAMPEQVQVVPGGNLVPLNDRVAIRQGVEQLRPYFRAELRRLTLVAGPTPEQRREIAVEAGRTLREEAAKLKPVANNPALRMSVGFSDPEKLVRTHFEAASWSRLSNVQSARYREEQDRKAKDRREVAILNIVAAYDRNLDLDEAQREKLCESLRAGWDERDFPYVESFFAVDTFVPIIPESRIAPILSEGQRKAWQKLKKYHYSWVRAGSPLQAVLTPGPAQDPGLDDDDVKAALGPEAAR